MLYERMWEIEEIIWIEKEKRIIPPYKFPLYDSHKQPTTNIIVCKCLGRSHDM